MSQNEEDAFSHLLDLTSDPEKINCVFPLVQQKLHLPRQRTPSPHAESRSNSRNSQQRPSSHNEKAKEAENDDLQCHSRRNTIATKGKQPHNQRFAMPAYTRRDTMPSKHAAPGSPKLRQPPQTTISQELVTNANEQTEKQITSSMLSLKHQSQSGPAFLHVDQQLERAQSADMLFLKPGNDDDELRRASFDTHSTSVIHTNGTSALHLHTGRRPGTGRKLPSTERLEQMHQNAQHQQRANLFDVPQIRAPQQVSPAPVSPRRGSFLLCRTPAVEMEPVVAPRKQTSSPLPRTQQLYDTGHVFSRSWNAPDSYVGNPVQNISYERQHENSFDYGRHEKQPLNSAPRQANYNATSPSNEFYHAQPAQFVRYAMMAGVGIQPAHAQLISTPRSNMLSLPLFQRQTKSVDEWNGANRHNASSSSSRFGPPSPLSERRTVSETAERHLIRQTTVQHLLPSNELSRQCQSLWRARDNLASSSVASGRGRPQFPSADYSDMAQSTSFDSVDTINDGDINDDRPIPQPVHNPLMNKPSFKLRRPTNADLRRQKYRSLLIQRQIASTIAASMAPMSPSSSNRPIVQSEVSSSDDEDGPVSDSVTSSNMFGSSFESSEQSVTTNVTDRPRVAPRGVARTTSAALRSIPNARFARLQQNGARSYDVAYRDYSVDSRTDNIFRDFVRVDPHFEALRLTDNPPPLRQPQPVHPQYHEQRERAPTLPSRFRAPNPKPTALNFSQSIASSSMRTSVYGEPQSFYRPVNQTHHYSLIRR